jgi:hypothetical protein
MRTTLTNLLGWLAAILFAIGFYLIAVPWAWRTTAALMRGW